METRFIVDVNYPRGLSLRNLRPSLLILMVN